MLETWTIYDNPSDVPGMYVARRFTIEPGNPEPQPTDDARASSSLELLRERFELDGYTWMPRWPGDDPVIVGVYMR